MSNLINLGGFQNVYLGRLSLMCVLLADPYRYRPALRLPPGSRGRYWPTPGFHSSPQSVLWRRIGVQPIPSKRPLGVPPIPTKWHLRVLRLPPKVHLSRSLKNRSLERLFIIFEAFTCYGEGGWGPGGRWGVFAPQALHSFQQAPSQKFQTGRARQRGT